MDTEDIAKAWLPFWVGDLAGIIAVGPLFLGIICRFYSRAQFWIDSLKDIAVANNSNYYLFKLLASAGLLSLIMFFAYLFPMSESHLAIFLMILPMMWISYTESPVRTAMTIALFSFYLAFLVNLLGLMEHVLIYQFAICVLAASAYFYLSIPSLLASNQELKHKTITDQLTGVASRHHLMAEVELEIEKSAENKSPLSLMVLDLDNFKCINDTLGHVEGDRVLVEIAQLVSRNLRKTDLLSRFGGDEFVVLLSDTPLDEATELAKRILKKIQQKKLKAGIPLSCSFGISELRSGEEFRQLFERADKALYRAKDGGRNQVQTSAGEAELSV